VLLGTARYAERCASSPWRRRRTPALAKAGMLAGISIWRGDQRDASRRSIGGGKMLA